MLRSSVVTPRFRPAPGGLRSSSMSKSSVSSVSSQGYRPSYCAAPSKYFSTSPITPVISPIVSSSAASSYSSPKSVSSLRVGSARAAGTSKYFDPEYPSRQFGSRLSRSYNAVQVRPQLHDEFYATSSLPGYGKDSWHAYKLSDSAIDDGEDIAHISRRRDYEAIRGAELAMQLPPSPKRAQTKLNQLALLARHGEPYKQALIFKPGRRSFSAPPRPTSNGADYAPQDYSVKIDGAVQSVMDWPAPRVIRNVMPSYQARVLKAKINANKANAAYVPPIPRASSVPPRSISAEKRVQVSKSVRPLRSARPASYSNARKIAAARSVENLSYGKEPKVKVVLETVPQGRDLLTSKERMLSREVVDLESPSGTMALKMRIAGAQAMLDRQGAMLGRYSKGGGDKDMIEVDEELRRVRTTQALRAKSVM